MLQYMEKGIYLKQVSNTFASNELSIYFSNITEPLRVCKIDENGSKYCSFRLFGYINFLSK